MLQSGQSGSGGGLHVFDRHCFSARPDDTDRWFECDFLPTIALQGVSQRVRQTKKSAATSVSEKKSFCGSPSSGGGFLQFGWMWPRSETAIRTRSEALRQTSVRAGEKESAGFDFGEGRPRSYALGQDASCTHEDAYAKAWFDSCRDAFPQPVRKAGPDVDFYNVSTYQRSIFFNTWVPSTASEFRKAENDPQLSLLLEFWRNNNAHVMLTAEDDSLPTDARLSGSNLNTKKTAESMQCATKK